MKKKDLKWGITAIIIVIALVVGIVLFCSPFVSLPFFVDFNQAKLEAIGKTVVSYDSDGEESISVSANSSYRTLEEIGVLLPASFVSVEDKRFYTHCGVDPIRLLGALKNNAVKGEFSQGGSTITQQLMKNTYLSGEKRLSRKLNEIRLSLQAERVLSKDKILEKYLNILYFGDGIYGVQDAAYTYFNKDANQLSPEEVAVLVAVINNPTTYNPYKNPDACLKRRNLVLKQMKNQEVISEEDYEMATDCPLSVREKSPVVNQYRYAMLNELQRAGIQIEKTTAIVTNQNRRAYNEAKTIIEEHTISDGYLGILLAKNRTGEILVNASTIPYDGTKFRFFPGSLLKPILCYAPLLEQNEMKICDVANDAPIKNSEYTPSNYADKYRGYITQSTALAESSNVVALKNLQKIGCQNAVRFAEKTGLHFDLEDADHEAIALGGVKRGFSAEELLCAYMTIARGGRKILPSYVNAAYQSGKCTFSANRSESRAMREDTSFLTAQMMKECVQTGTAKGLRSFENVYAKTGTVGDKNGNSYCYCMAFSPQYTVMAYVCANKEKLPQSVTGGTIPTKMAKKMFAFLQDDSTLPIPDSVVKKSIDWREWVENNDVVLSNETTPYKDRKEFWFSVNCLPKRYRSADDFLLRYFPTDTDEFDIFDRFFD